ncbi:hypothetical protein [Gordonia rhizosphera]|uniref:Uncharacterized protein n=1 Tax=Gordonia rhizosphera NBRC 16068 TaxID=1108045 RepID=K6VVC8_9ACTN|nr:hypothetical protein [Gordonia rhizosphera]GAB90815.1 hypothetical protein GORHZ_118_00310 [Gordonia rhizosphera NBRC 16068]
MAKLSPQVSALKAAHWKQRLAPHLADGEVIRGFASACHLKPATEGVAFTNARVVGFNTDSASSDGMCVVFAVPADEIVGFDLAPVRLVPTMSVRTPSGLVTFGAFDKTETEFIAYFLEYLQREGVDPAAREGIMQLRDLEEQRRRAESQWEAAQDGVQVFGEPMTAAQWTTIHEHSAAGETPWLVLNSGRAGQLVAFDDRVVLLKKGHPADEAEGVRETTIPYPEITGIEYNCGALSGDIEVLTPDHPECSDRDQWLKLHRDDKVVSYGSTSISNALSFPKPYYRQALPEIDQLRRRITATQERAVSSA